METIWFFILTTMLGIYVVLDGFDFGAGILHLFVARDEEERMLIQRSIGPFWDGNEVWLIASGGIVFFAFPLLYAVAFSGFYLPLIFLLWLLILRGVSLELRNHLNSSLWKSFFGKGFGIASLLMALILGAALGNLVRGVNFGGVVDGVSHYESQYFFTTLWTNFQPGENPGVLDWFTVLMGLIGVVTLTIHGANWVLLKSDGPFRRHLAEKARLAWMAAWPLIGLSIWAAADIRPELLDRFNNNVLLYFLPLSALAGFAALPYFQKRGQDLLAFLGSSWFILGMLLSTALALFPVMLPSSNHINPGITIYDAATSHYGLAIGLRWWIFGIILVIAYFIIQHRIFSGKIASDEDIYGEH